MAIKSGGRELIDTDTDKPYVKRNRDGTVKASGNVGSISRCRFDEANRKVRRSLSTLGTKVGAPYSGMGRA